MSRLNSTHLTRNHKGFVAEFDYSSALEGKVRVVDGLKAHPVPALGLEGCGHKLAAEAFTTTFWCMKMMRC